MDIFFEWLARFSETQIFAAIIGALIGLIPAFTAFILNSWYEKRKKRIADYQTYKAWLNGLTAELNHIKKCINEISNILKKPPSISTKRMNTDFLEKARLILLGYDEDLDFLESLTNTYRDIVHSNNMLDRLENSESNVRPNVESSIVGVLGSVHKLSDEIQAKLKNLKRHN